MTNLNGSNYINRVTRAPVYQVDEANMLNHAHATSMLSFNEIGSNISFDLLSNLQRAGSVLPEVPPDFEYIFVAVFVQFHRPKGQ